MIDSDEQEENDKKIRDFVMNYQPASDMQKFIDLYHSVGIELEAVIYNPDSGKAQFGYQFLKLISVGVYDDKNELIQGYNDFFTDIWFDKTGKFLVQCIWE
jgi:hypothetical protein